MQGDGRRSEAGMSPRPTGVRGLNDSEDSTGCGTRPVRIAVHEPASRVEPRRRIRGPEHQVRCCRFTVGRCAFTAWWPRPRGGLDIRQRLLAPLLEAVFIGSRPRAAAVTHCIIPDAYNAFL